MADGVVVHREVVTGTGTWSPRPPALSGITPVAVLVFGSFQAPNGDGVTGDNVCQLLGISDGVTAGGQSQYFENGVALSVATYGSSPLDLVYAGTATGAIFIQIAPPSFVSGGFDANIVENTSNPEITTIFFYGDDWEASCSRVSMPGSVDDTTIVPTFSSGAHNNQLLISFGLSVNNQTYRNFAEDGKGLGLAYRQGASTVPVDQKNYKTRFRNNTGSSNIAQVTLSQRFMSILGTSAITNEVECTAIRDNEVELTKRRGSGRRDHMLLVLSTGTKKCWSGVVLSPTTNGTWAVSDPAFSPVVAVIDHSQVTTLDTYEVDDLAIIGESVGTSTDEFSNSHAAEDAVATMVSKNRQNSQFLDVLQDDGSEGWKAGPNDFSLTATGYQVENVVVDGGGGGAPLIARHWLSWAIEGVAGPPPAIEGSGALQAQDAAVVGVGEVISPTVITGTGALQAQDAAIVGAGDVISPVVGTGTLQAQEATVVGVGDVAGAAIGTGALQAQDAQVSGVGAVVHAGSGALQAQDAAVVGVGEVGNVRTGAGALQAGEAAVVGTGVRVSVGSGTLQAQDAAVSGAGVVEGLTSGTGVLQAQSAAVVGTGHLIRVGSGALQAQAAQVTGVGAILGDLTLSPADIAAIADAVYAKLVSEGLVQQINEIWQRRGLDPANPQTYDKAGNEIRVGNITIDLSGDPSSVTQTRQP